MSNTQGHVLSQLVLSLVAVITVLDISRTELKPLRSRRNYEGQQQLECLRRTAALSANDRSTSNKQQQQDGAGEFEPAKQAFREGEKRATQKM